MEDMERRNAIQYMLMIYQDEKLRAKMSEAQEGKFMQEHGEFTQGTWRKRRELRAHPGGNVV